jgi:membrane protein implicated in regulation of membrane protease activity
MRTLGLIVAIPIAVLIAAFNLWLYDRFFGIPGLPLIPDTWWQVALMFVIPVILVGYWLLERIVEYRENRRYEHLGTLEEEILLAEEMLRRDEQSSSGWRTLREGDSSAKEGMAALSAAERRARR